MVSLVELALDIEQDLDTILHSLNLPLHPLIHSHYERLRTKNEELLERVKKVIIEQSHYKVASIVTYHRLGESMNGQTVEEPGPLQDSQKIIRALYN